MDKNPYKSPHAEQAEAAEPFDFWLLARRCLLGAAVFAIVAFVAWLGIVVAVIADVLWGR